MNIQNNNLLSRLKNGHKGTRVRNQSKTGSEDMALCSVWA